MQSTGLIPEEHREHIKTELNEKLQNPVKLLVFTQEVECRFCSETRQLAQEVAGLNEKITAEVYDFVSNAEKAKEFGVERIPCVVILGEKDYGIRFYGMPYGFEFKTLLEALTMASQGRSFLSEDTKAKLAELKTPAHIRVFVTLTCPHCAEEARMAYRFAVESDMIRADVFDAAEFPDMAIKYMLVGVPKTVINEKTEFVGSVPENLFLEQVLAATR